MMTKSTDESAVRVTVETAEAARDLRGLEFPLTIVVKSAAGNLALDFDEVGGFSILRGKGVMFRETLFTGSI